METKEGNEVNTWFNLKVYWSFLRKYKFIFIFLIFLILITEAKQIADKYLIKLAMDNSADYVAGTIARGDLLHTLLILLVVLVAFVLVVNFGINFLRIHILGNLETKMMFDLKERYFSHIIALDHKFFSTHKTGSLISRMGRGGGAIERLTDSLVFEFSPLIMQFSVLIISLIYLDRVSAIVISCTVAAFLIFAVGFQRLRNKYNLIENKKEDIEKGNMADIFTNVDSIKYFGKEPWIKDRYMNFVEETRIAQVASRKMWRNMSTGQSFILGLGTIALLYFSFRSFLNGTMSLGTLTFIYTTYLGLMAPLYGFAHGVKSFTKSLTDFQDLFEYGLVESNIKDKPDAKNIKISSGEIEFENIGFSYDGKRKVFDNFNLKVPANKKIALVGHSGCGKTSLVKLLYRLYDVQKGSIKVDGKDIRDVKHESLRSEMSIVPQECVLFDDTIYNNIKFSNPNATREQVMKAVKFAQLDKIISMFPQKENTIVGERGIRLSGGEKQRVSIARAILADKKILVLDEATSSLDSETEHEIQKDLQKLMGGRTSIVIAHRLSTIMGADIIVVLKEGKIVQMGNHNQLIGQSGEYKKLWNLQRGGYIK